MKKIQTLFERNRETDRLVRDEVASGCEWVANGEGVPTQKLDGTACMIKDGRLYKRYTLKAGRTVPDGFVASQEPDVETGKQPGWVPVGDSKSDKWHRKAFEGSDLPDGTYELLGPMVQGNPEKVLVHTLVPHGRIALLYAPRTFSAIHDYLASHDYEGIVWWRDLADPDCDKAKIKCQDFGIVRR